MANSEADFVRVGKVKDAHGIRGELFIVLFAGEAAWLDQLKEIRLVRESGESEAKLFSVKSARFHKNGLIIKSGDIRDRNTAESLKGLLLEIPSTFLVSQPGEQLYLSEIHGFVVCTQAKGDVGRIVGFTSNGAQDLLVVEAQSGEQYEIPFVDAFVEKIDYDNRKILMELPLGLLGELDEPDDKDGDRDEGGDADEPGETDDADESEQREEGSARKPSDLAT